MAAHLLAGPAFAEECRCSVTLEVPESVTVSLCDKDAEIPWATKPDCTTVGEATSGTESVEVVVNPDGSANPAVIHVDWTCGHGNVFHLTATVPIFVLDPSARPGDLRVNAPAGGVNVSVGGTASGSPAGELVIALSTTPPLANSSTPPLINSPTPQLTNFPLTCSLRGFRSADADIVRDGHPVPLQIRTAEGLLVRTGEGASFTLSHYRPADVAPDFDDEGRYQVVAGAVPTAAHTFSVSNGGLSVATVRGGAALPEVTVSRGEGGCSVATAGGSTTLYSAAALSADSELRTWRTFGADGALASVRSEVVTNTPRGWLPVVSTVGEGEDAATTLTDYWLEGCPERAVGLVRRRVNPDGSSSEHWYDGEGRETNAVTRCPGFPDRRVEKSYSPFLPPEVHAPPSPAYRDDLTDEPWVPRVETEYVGGVAVRRVARAVAIDQQRRRHEEELVLDDPAADPAAAWVAGAGLRSLRVRMPESDCRPCSRRPKKEVRPDGTLSTWHYGSGDYAPGDGTSPGVFTPAAGGEWFRTVRVDGCLSSTNGVAFRTVRETTVEHRPSRQVVLRETAVCTEASPWPDECAYETVAWRETFLDADDREVATAASDGTTTATEWSAGRVASRTAADGTVTDYAYDADGRVTSETVSAPGRPAVATARAYDGAGRLLSETVSSGDSSPVIRHSSLYAYDTQGRRRVSVSLGVTNLHDYAEGGGLVSETTVRAPGTPLAATNETVRSADGSYSASFLNGVQKGAALARVLESGVRSARSFTGPGGTNSPAWTETRALPNGLVAAELRPAFGGGHLVTTNLYDARGLPLSSVTLHFDHSASSIVHSAFRCYDALARAVVSANDVDGDGELSFASDAVASNDTRYAVIGGDWWEVSSSWSFPVDGSAAPVLSGATRRRLTGLGPGGGPGGAGILPATATSGGVGGSPATATSGGAGILPATATSGGAGILPATATSGGVGGSPATLLLSESVTADALGNETIARRTLDPSTGLVTDETISPASALPAISYTLGGLLVSNVTATGVTTLYGYDALGRRTSVTQQRRDPSTLQPFNSSTVTYAYDERDNLVSETDAAGSTTAYAYDALNRRTAVMHNAQCTMHNGGEGNPVNPVNPVETTFTAYDAEDRVIAQWGATYPVLYTYDAFGRLATLSTTRDEEAAGQLATDHWPLATDASWDTTRWLYDESTGLLTNKLYADGLGPSYNYTPDGRLATRLWARGVLTSYAYDFAGNLTNAMQNAECRMQNDGGANSSLVTRHSSLFSYDRMGRMRSAIVEGVSTNHYVYSIHGQLTNEVQNGVVLSRTYDALGRPTGYSLCSSAPLRLNYSYDSLGRFCGVGFNAEAQRGRGDFEYSYLPGTDLVSGYTASAGGSGGATTRPLFSRTVAYESGRNLIAAITNSFTNPSTLQPFNLSTFAYLNDALGRRVEVTRTGLAFGDLAGATDAYGYNDRSEVVSSRRTLDSAEVRGFDYDYAYDPIGNRICTTNYDEQGNALVSSYSANALNQYTQRTVPGHAALRGEILTNATVTVNERPVWRSGSYFYGGDSADNTASSVYKDLEIYAAINPSGTNTPDTVYATTGTVFIARTPESFTYDADGNMTSDGRFHYHWNGENRLVMASNDTVVVTYAYDHRGRMVRKAISHRGTEARRMEYLWDDWNIIREIQVSEDPLATGHCPLVTDYVWGLDLDGTMQGAGGVGGLLAVVRDDGVFLPAYDANGNVSEYVSTNGEIVAHYDYSPFGEPLVASGPLAFSFTHQFSTKPYCAVTGFSEYQMRKYRPRIGRWMSRDPIFEQGGMNLCVFLLNSTLSNYDALGKASSFQKWTCNFIYSIFVYISNFFPPGGGPPPPDVTFPGEIDPPPIVEPGIPGIEPPTNAIPKYSRQISATISECGISPETARISVLSIIGAVIIDLLDRLGSFAFPIIIIVPESEYCHPDDNCEPCFS